MSGEPRWLEADEVIELNRRIVAGTGEDHIVKDRGLLESALWRPRHMLTLSSEEPDALEMAVAICIGISRNHPFIQGNKRTGFAAMEIFLYHAGYELRVPDIVEVADFQIAVIEHERTEEEFLLMLDEYLHERVANRFHMVTNLRDPFADVTLCTLSGKGVTTGSDPMIPAPIPHPPQLNVMKPFNVHSGYDTVSMRWVRVEFRAINQKKDDHPDDEST